MGVEWGGKGPDKPERIPRHPGLLDRELAKVAVEGMTQDELSAEPDTHETEGEMTTQEMVDAMAPRPRPPAKSARKLWD